MLNTKPNVLVDKCGVEVLQRRGFKPFILLHHEEGLHRVTCNTTIDVQHYTTRQMAPRSGAVGHVEGVEVCCHRRELGDILPAGTF